MSLGPAFLATEASVRHSAASWKASHPLMIKAPVSGWWEGFWEDNSSAVAEDKVNRGHRVVFRCPRLTEKVKDE